MRRICNIAAIISLLIAFNINGSQASNPIDSLQKILKKATGDDKINALINLSQAQLENNFSQALNTANETVDLAKKTSSTLYCKSLENLGLLYKKTCNYESAIFFFKKTLENKKNDERIATILNNVGSCYAELGKFDTALVYHTQAYKISETIGDKKGTALAITYQGNVYLRSGNFDQALKLYQKSLALRQDNKIKEDVASSFENIAEVYKRLNQYDLALQNLNKALDIRNALGDKSKTAACLNGFGNFYMQVKMFEKALENYNQALQLRIEIGDKKDIASTYNNIGTLHRELQNYDKALDYYNKALQIRSNLGNKEAIAATFNSIGSLYWLNKDYNNAIKFYKKALDIRQQLDEKIQIAATLKNMGIIYKDMNDFPTALDYYQKSIDISLSVNDVVGVASVQNLKGNLYKKNKEFSKAVEFYTNALQLYKNINQKKDIALIANNLGDVFKQQSLSSKAITSYNEAYNLAISIHEKSVAKDAAQALSDLYKTTGNCSKGMEFLGIFTALKDSIQNDMNKKRIAEMEFENEMKLKDNELLQQQFKLKTTENELSRQRTYIIVSVFIILLIAIFSILVLYQFSQKKKAYVLLAEKSTQLAEANNQLADKNKELAVKNDQITDSINYAKQIQEAILPASELLSQYFPNHFVMYRPKEIVSGDFYWFSVQENYRFIAVVDCTGHGVPGAFMSMIGNTLLNEIITIQKTFDTAEILQKLDNGVIHALKQDTCFDKRQEDGMDITLCRIDTSTNTLQVSLANHRMVIIKNGKLENIDGDSFPIGGLFKVKQRKKASYASHIIPIEKGMKIYMHSDGIIDQFGGTNNERFRTSTFHKLLLETQQNDMYEQFLDVNQHFDEWKNNRKQLDDVLVVGIEL